MAEIFGVDDGTRTHDNRNHNPGLYQLSYIHRRYGLDRGWAAIRQIVGWIMGLEPTTTGITIRDSTN